MTALRLPALAAALAAAGPFAAPLAAQNPPRVAYVFPAGASRGASVEVVVGGRYLEEPTAAFVSGAGVVAVVRDFQRPLNPKERAELRDKVQMLEQQQKEGKLDEAGRKELAASRKTLATLGRQPANPQLAEQVTLSVTVAADAVPGIHELRVRTAAGLTNPLRFLVGSGRAVRETEPNDRAADATAAASLPVVVDGQLLPGDVDRFRVALRKGQHLRAAVRARLLLPYLADAVPGWCQATLQLVGPDGHEVAFDDDHRFDPDPQLEYDVPADGDYELVVADALHRGREDFVYRLEIDATGGGTTAAAPVAAAGPEPAPPPLGPFAPCAEHEPDDQPAQAQHVPWPSVVVGRIERPGDVDVYAIDAHPGQTFVAELLGRRIGSPIDAVLRLVDPRGKEIGVDDDTVDPAYGLVTHQADAVLRGRFALQGTYLLTVRDLQGKGGPDFTYRLRLGPPVPDFSLRVVPSQLNLRPGASAALTVHALRQDGFAGEIVLQLVDPPPGFSLSGGVIPAGVDKLVVTVTAPENPPDAPVPLVLHGRATLGKNELVRPAVPAEDLMQAFAWHQLVPMEQLLACVLRNGPPLGRLARGDDAPVVLRPGGTADVVFQLAGARRQLALNLACSLREPPAGLSVASTRLERDGFHVVLAAAKDAAPGLCGNLLIEVSAERPAAADPAAKKAPNRQRLAVLLPAVRFVVRKPQGDGPP